MEQKKSVSGLAIAGLVLAIIGLVFSIIPILNTISYVLGALALIFGVIGIFKSSKKVLPIVATILAVLCFITTTAVKSATVKAVSDAVDELSSNLEDLSGDNTDSILANDVMVELGEFQVENNGFWDETKLVAKVTNKLSETKSFSLTVEAAKPDGTRLSLDYIYATSLGAGQSQEFELFTLISSDDIDKYKGAAFKVIEASKY